MKKEKVFLFFVRLLLIAIPFHVVMLFVNFYPLQVLVANLVVIILSLIGLNFKQLGAFILSSDSSFYINPDCTGWKSIFFFLALVIAIPDIEIKARLKAFLMLPVLFALNILRIISSILVYESFGVELALFIHDILWQLFTIFVVLMLWMIWLHLFHKHKK